MKLKSIIIGQSGGPTTVINASLQGIIEAALSNPNIEHIYGALNGIEGILNKNIIDLCGKPLMAYSIEAALKAEVFSRVIVSTDSERYAEIAKDYGAEVMMRDEELASDTAKTIDAVLHAVDFVCAQTAGGLVNAREAGIDDGGGAAALADDDIF